MNLSRWINKKVEKVFQICKYKERIYRYIRGDSFEKSETCMDPNAKWVVLGNRIWDLHSKILTVTYKFPERHVNIKLNDGEIMGPV